MEMIDQLRCDDADHAAMPSLTGDDDHRAGADLQIGLDDVAGRRDDVGLFLLASQILGIELLRQLARLPGHRLVRSKQQSGGNVWRAHPSCRVDARREHEADVIAVDLLARQPAAVQQRAQADLVRPLRQHRQSELREHRGSRPRAGRRRRGCRWRPP